MVGQDANGLAYTILVQQTRVQGQVTEVVESFSKSIKSDEFGLHLREVNIQSYDGRKHTHTHTHTHTQTTFDEKYTKKTKYRTEPISTSLMEKKMNKRTIKKLSCEI